MTQEFNAPDFRLMVSIRANAAADRIEGLDKQNRVREVAKRTGLPVSEIADLFNNGGVRHAVPLIQIAAVLEVTVEYLLGKEDIEVASLVNSLRGGAGPRRTSSQSIKAITAPGSLHPVAFAGSVLDELGVEPGPSGLISMFAADDVCAGEIRKGDLLLIARAARVSEGVVVLTSAPNEYVVANASEAGGRQVFGRVVTIVRPDKNIKTNS